MSAGPPSNPGASGAPAIGDPLVPLRYLLANFAACLLLASIATALYLLAWGRWDWATFQGYLLHLVMA